MCYHVSYPGISATNRPANEGFSYFMPASSVAVYGGNDGILFEQQKKGLTSVSYTHLPVGGIKEKILAAKRAGIKEIIMSVENKKNIDEIQDI